MNDGQVEDYLRAVEEMVMDEEKIVTYKVLSRTLNLNVNTGKQLLYLYFIKQQKIGLCTVSATHLLAGLLKNGTFLVSIVDDDKLHEAYSEYDKITSEHVYSVQKGKASGLKKNSQMLFAADSSLPSSESYIIKYHKTLKEKISDTGKKNTFQDKEVKVEVKADEKKECKGSSGSTQKDGKETKKAGHISNFFNNQSQRKKVVKQEAIVSKAEEPVALEEKPECSSKTGEKTRVKERKKRKRILSAIEDTESDEESRDAEMCSEPTVPEISERLRISDDDSNEDDIFQNKRKRKKIVSKSVLRDDGFLETFKEVVYETDSDSESRKQKEARADEGAGKAVGKTDKKEPTEGGRGKASVQKTKQSTLFSFFKKN